MYTTLHEVSLELVGANLADDLFIHVSRLAFENLNVKISLQSNQVCIVFMFLVLEKRFLRMVIIRMSKEKCGGKNAQIRRNGINVREGVVTCENGEILRTCWKITT